MTFQMGDISKIELSVIYTYMVDFWQTWSLTFSPFSCIHHQVVSTVMSNDMNIIIESL